MCDVVDVIGNTPTHVPCKKRAWKVTSATVWGVGVSPLLSKDILPFNKPHKTNVFHMYQHSKGLSNGERIFLLYIAQRLCCETKNVTIIFILNLC